MSRIDTRSLRRAFGSFMTGVTVVTARAANGELVGFTANSFTSVSIDPPLLLVCPGNQISSYSVFNEATHFAVSVLAEGQEHVSNTFASVSQGRFDKVNWQLDENDCPLIEGAVATFSCSVHQRHVAGDHLVLIGQVLQLDSADLPGLGYCSNGYFSLSKEQQSDASSQSDLIGVAGAIIEYDGHILVEKKDAGHGIPTVVQTESHGPRSSLQQYFNARGAGITLGPVYSIYDDPAQQKRFTFFRARADSSGYKELGTFETIDSLDNLQFPDQAQTTMMARFATESRIKAYGLYIGNTESGDLHLLAEQQD